LLVLFPPKTRHREKALIRLTLTGGDLPRVTLQRRARALSCKVCLEVRLRDYLTCDEVAQLLRAAKKGLRHCARNHTKILLAFRRGLRELRARPRKVPTMP
jgi:hypothetical protein